MKEQHKKKLLADAADACFFTGIGDLAAQLSQANMAFGIAKVRAVQEALKITPDAHFISAPDATVTRNIDRWKAGFGYGGRLRYSGDFVVLDIKSNCCGMYLGRMADYPSPVELLDRIEDLQGNDRFAAETGTSWDFGTSNHFIHVVRYDQPLHGDRYGVLCHGSGPELRGPGGHGPGLYLNRSPRLQELAEQIPTPWGSLNIIRDPAGVAEFHNGMLRADEFSRDRRTRLVKALFPGIEEVSNLTHQGARGPGDVHLGAVAESGEVLVPVALRADLPIYLLRQLPNLSDSVIEKLGFYESAERLGLLPFVRTANLLPHGGGYTIPGYFAIAKILERGMERVYEMEVRSGQPARAFHSHFRHVPFNYRGEEVIRRVEELAMGEVVTRAVPLYEFMV